MDILTLIKNRRTIRKYTNKPIPKKVLDKIIEAGVWGPSIHHWQPQKFIVITNKKVINKIANIVIKKLKLIKMSNFVLGPTCNSLINAKVLICIYNSKIFSNFVKKFGKEYYKNAKTVELLAIAATIQNMILVADYLGVGSCWLSSLLYCSKEIASILKINDAELVAVVTLGYPNEEGKRSPRKSIKDVLKLID